MHDTVHGTVDPTNAGRCPSEQQLAALLEGVDVSVQEHVDDCPQCLARLQSMVSISSRISEVVGFADDVPPEHDEYEIISNEPVAQGGMGLLWLVRDRKHHRRLAMKVLSARLARMSGMVERFLYEAKVNAQLQHAGILQILDDGVLPDGRPYYVMPFIHARDEPQLPAGTLEDELTSNSNHAEKLVRLLSVVRDVARTLGHLHNNDVVHRDVKPQNVLLGDHQGPFLLDLGLAKRMGDLTAPAPQDDADRSPRGPRFVKTESSHGTPGYMPPEQARNDRDAISPRSDVFSLGAIITRILTGSPVFAGDTRDSVMAATAAGDTRAAMRKLRTSPADVELVNLACRCIESDPEDRPPHGDAVADDLDRYFASLESKRRKAAVRKVALLWVSVAATIAVAASAWLLTINKRLVRSEADATQHAARANANAQLAAERAAEAAEAEKAASRARSSYALAAAQMLTQAFDPATQRSDGTLITRARRAALEARDSLVHDQAATTAAELGLAGALRVAPPPATSFQLPPQSVLEVAASPDDRAILISFAGGEIRLYDAETGAHRALERRHEDVVWSLAFSESGSLFATGGADGRVVVWDAQTAKPLFAHDDHERDVTAVAFSGDGGRIISADGVLGRRQGELLQSASPKLGAGNGYATIVRLGMVQPRRISSRNPSRLVVWDVGQRRRIQSRQRQPGTALAVAITRDGARAVCGNEDGTIELVDLAEAGVSEAKELGMGAIQSIGFVDDARILLADNRGNTTVLDVETGDTRLAVARKSPAGAGPYMRATLGPAGRFSAFTHRDGTARLYDAVTGRVATSILSGHGEGTRVGPIAISENWLTLSADGVLWRYPLENRDGRTPLLGATPDIVSWSTCFRRQRIASCASDGVVRVWDGESGRIVSRGRLPSISSQNSVAFSEDGHVLVAAGNGHVRVWTPDVDAKRDMDESHDVVTHLTSIRALAVAPQGDIAAVGDNDGAIEVFDPRGEATKGRFKAPREAARDFELQVIAGAPAGQPLKPRSGRQPVSQLLFSPDGQRLLVVSGLRATLWDPQKREMIAELAPTGGQGVGSEFAFSPEGTELVSKLQGDSARMKFLIWDAVDGSLRRQLDVSAPYGSSPIRWRLIEDGQLLVIRSNGNAILHHVAENRELVRTQLVTGRIRGATIDGSGRRFVFHREHGDALVIDIEQALAGNRGTSFAELTVRELSEGMRLPNGKLEEPLIADPQTVDDPAREDATSRRLVQQIAVGGTSGKLSGSDILWINGAGMPTTELAIEHPNVAVRRVFGLFGGPFPAWPGDRIALGRKDQLRSLVMHATGVGVDEPSEFDLPGAGGLQTWRAARDTKRVAVAFEDGTIRWLRIERGDVKIGGPFTPPPEFVSAVEQAEPSMGDWISTLRSNAMTIRFPVEALSLSDDGRITAAGHATLSRGHLPGIVTFFENDELAAWRVCPGGSVTAVAVDDTGRSVATGQIDGTIRVFRTDGDELVETHATRTAHQGTVTAVLFGSDGQTLYSSGSDQAVCLWSVDAELRRDSVFEHPAPVVDIGLTPDRGHLISTSADGFARVYRLTD